MGHWPSNVDTPMRSRPRRTIVVLVPRAELVAANRLQKPLDKCDIAKEQRSGPSVYDQPLEDESRLRGRLTVRPRRPDRNATSSHGQL